MSEEKTPYDPDKYVKAFYGSQKGCDWEKVRVALDKLGETIHRSEDAEHRLAFTALVRVIQAYEEAHRPGENT
jgi:hypothetical protein